MTTLLIHIIRMLHLQLLLAPRLSRTVGACYCDFSSPVRRGGQVIPRRKNTDRQKLVVSTSHYHDSSSSSFVPRPSVLVARKNTPFTRDYSTRMMHSATSTSCGNANNLNLNDDDDDEYIMKDDINNRNTSPNFVITPPWSHPSLKSASSKTYSRFRQHVNPLSRRYTMAAELSPDWPSSVFDNVKLPLYLDIGCGKGGFLLELARRSKEKKCSNMNDESGGETVMPSSTYYHHDDGEDKEGNQFDATDSTNDTNSLLSSSSSFLWPLPSHMNYLGLEIRPGVSQYAQARVTKRKLDGKVSFVGCNANVDLDRLLTLYHGENENDDGGGWRSIQNHRQLAFVSIQFPDPHFKKAHTKRRVVTSQLVSTLAKFMEEGSAVFLQSDVKDALISMREKFVHEQDDDRNYGDRENVDERMNEIRPLVAARYFDELLLPDGTTVEEGVEFGMANPLGVPTEREKSVVANGLPVYRTMFRRNGIEFDDS